MAFGDLTLFLWCHETYPACQKGSKVINTASWFNLALLPAFIVQQSHINSVQMTIGGDRKKMDDKYIFTDRLSSALVIKG